jgi:hypothetical protein
MLFKKNEKNIIKMKKNKILLLLSFLKIELMFSFFKRYKSIGKIIKLLNLIIIKKTEKNNINNLFLNRFVSLSKILKKIRIEINCPI